MRFLIVTMMAFGALSVTRCIERSCPVTTLPCPETMLTFGSSCGFAHFASTCHAAGDPVGACSGTYCTITASEVETCDVSLVLGDGTSHTAHVVFSELPQSTSGCPSGCPNEFKTSMTVDGVVAPGAVIDAEFTFQSATCMASDAGLDGSTDSATDAIAE